jgi:hypothetical protein
VVAYRVKPDFPGLYRSLGCARDAIIIPGFGHELVMGTADAIAAVTHSSTRCSRKEFAITDTELKLIAAAAIMGLSKTPNTG